jgi:hypothetical protein
MIRPSIALVRWHLPHCNAVIKEYAESDNGCWVCRNGPVPLASLSLLRIMAVIGCRRAFDMGQSITASYGVEKILVINGDVSC